MTTYSVLVERKVRKKRVLEKVKNSNKSFPKHWLKKNKVAVESLQNFMMNWFKSGEGLLSKLVLLITHIMKVKKLQIKLVPGVTVNNTLKKNSPVNIYWEQVLPNHYLLGNNNSWEYSPQLVH